MPKLSVDFPCPLSLSVTEEDKVYLIAVGYMMGAGGEYNQPARNFINQGIRRYVEGLAPADQKRFDEILANVRIQVTRRVPGEQKNPVT